MNRRVRRAGARKGYWKVEQAGKEKLRKKKIKKMMMTIMMMMIIRSKMYSPHPQDRIELRIACPSLSSMR